MDDFSNLSKSFDYPLDSEPSEIVYNIDDQSFTDKYGKTMFWVLGGLLVTYMVSYYLIAGYGGIETNTFSAHDVETGQKILEGLSKTKNFIKHVVIWTISFVYAGSDPGAAPDPDMGGAGSSSSYPSQPSTSKDISLRDIRSSIGKPSVDPLLGLELKSDASDDSFIDTETAKPQSTTSTQESSYKNKGKAPEILNPKGKNKTLTDQMVDLENSFKSGNFSSNEVGKNMSSVLDQMKNITEKLFNPSLNSKDIDEISKIMGVDKTVEFYKDHIDSNTLDECNKEINELRDKVLKDEVSVTEGAEKYKEIIDKINKVVKISIDKNK